MGKISAKATLITTVCLVLLSCIFATGSEKPKNSSEKPNIGELMEMSKTMPDNVANQIISEYTGKVWVEKPYLEATVSVYDNKNQFIERSYPDKVYFEFREMLLGKDIFWGPCLHVSVRELEFSKEEQGVIVAYRLKPKELCQRYNENQDDLIMAFFRKGSNWGHGKFRSR